MRPRWKFLTLLATGVVLCFGAFVDDASAGEQLLADEPRFRELAEELSASVQAALREVERAGEDGDVLLERALELLQWHGDALQVERFLEAFSLEEGERALLHAARAANEGRMPSSRCEDVEGWEELEEALRYYCARHALSAEDARPREEAARTLADLAEGARDAYWAGRAALVLGDAALARERLEEALELRPASVAPALAMSEALLQLQEASRAGAMLSALMEDVPWHPMVWVRTASLNRRMGSADALVAVALAAAEVLRPGLAEARLVHAAHLLDAGRHREAEAQLASLPGAAFGSAERFGLALAAAFLRESMWPDALWPVPSAFGVAAVMEAGLRVERAYRYPDALALYRRALELDEGDARLRTRIAVAWSRAGDDERALEHSRAALALDPDSEEAQMLVRLHEEELGVYLYLEDPVMPGLRYRFHEEEIGVLQHLVPAATRETLRRYAAWYGMAPPLPLTVEVIREPELFGVRTVGRADISPHGICFGPVVVIRSPVPGDFNWRHVLEHELSHSFTLSASRYRVPRWLTEGLAELDTRRLRPDTRRSADLPVARALRSGRLPALAQLDRAFLRASTAGIAYQQAFLFAEWIEERSGRSALVALLEALGEGMELEDAFRSALGLRLEVVERLFDAWLRNHLAPLTALYEPDPEAWRGRLRSADPFVERDPAQGGEGALILWFGGDRRAASFAEEVLRQAPRDPAARYVSVSAAIEAGDVEAAVAGLREFEASGYRSFTLHARLGRVALEREELGLARTHLEEAASLLDAHAPLWRTIAELAEKEGWSDLAARERSARLDWGDALSRDRLLEVEARPAARYRLLDELMEIRPLSSATLLEWVESALLVGDCSRVEPIVRAAGLHQPAEAGSRAPLLRASWQRQVAERYHEHCAPGAGP